MRPLALLAALFLSTASLSTALAAPVTLSLSVVSGDQPFTGKFTTSAGQVIDTTLRRMYVSNVALVRADGSEVPLPGLTLLKLGEATGYQNVVALTADAPEGSYRGVRFDVGVPRDLNHRDASTQPAPLGLDVGGNTRRITASLGDLLKPGTAFNVRAGQTAVIPVKLDAARMVATGIAGAAFDLNDAEYVQVHGGAVADQPYLNLAGAFSLIGAPQAAGMTMPGSN